MVEYFNRTARNAIAAAVLALAYLPGCGGGSPTANLLQPTPTPVAKAHLTGKVKGTFSGRDICDYKVEFSGQPVSVKNDCSYEIDISPGTYSMIVTSNSLLLPRKKTVEVPAPNPGALSSPYDFDGIEADSGFNIDHYKQIGLGAYEPGINHGASVRFRPGVNPKVVFVRKDAPAGSEAMVKRAAGVIPEMTGGILSYTFEAVDAMPLLSEGMIVVSYPGVNGGSTAAFNTNYIISNSDVQIPRSWSSEEDVLSIKHELTHAIGFDHSPNGIMNNKCGNCPPSRDDEMAGKLKYVRMPGHVLAEYDAD